ncbi:MAG: PAS domain-containing sensor histidine kinase [Archaeoglobaceae archaeon]
MLTAKTLQMTFPLIWALVAIAWLLSFPLHPEDKLDYEDVAIEGLILVSLIVVFFVLKALPKVMLGWGVFVIPWITDLLDEFTSEPEFFDTTLEGILKSLGLILILLGLLKAYRKLEEQKEIAEKKFKWFSTLVEIAPFPMIVYDERGFVYVNKAVEENTGYSRSELLGGVFWELFEGKELEKMREVITKRLREEKVEPYTLKIKRKDGTYRTLISYGTHLSIEGKRYGLAAFADVTELEEKRKIAEDLSKMISLINKTLRHDVLNALTSAVGFMELYKEEKSEEYCEKVRRSVDRAIAIVKNLKKFESAVRSGELRVVNVREIAESVSKNFAIPIEIEGECDAVADEGLATVFENIIQNAVQHSGTEKITIKINRIGEFCEIRISDYGKGIPDEIKEKIFEEGFSYGEKASTGLGLYVVKKIVERYEGKIWVENTVPKGATFVVRLRAV